VSFWLVLAFRRRAARFAEEDPTFESSGQLFERPYSVATVLAILAVLILFRQMPALASDLLKTALLVPVLRLLAQVVGPAARRPVLALAGFYVVDRVRAVLEEAPHVERLVFAAEMAAACGVLLWLLRPSRVRDLPAGAGRLALVGRGLRLAL